MLLRFSLSIRFFSNDKKNIDSPKANGYFCEEEWKIKPEYRRAERFLVVNCRTGGDKTAEAVA